MTVVASSISSFCFHRKKNTHIFCFRSYQLTASHFCAATLSNIGALNELPIVANDEYEYDKYYAKNNEIKTKKKKKTAIDNRICFLSASVYRSSRFSILWTLHTCACALCSNSRRRRRRWRQQQNIIHWTTKTIVFSFYFSIIFRTVPFNTTILSVCRVYER